MAAIKNAREAALALLSRRDHSCLELRQKLSRHFAQDEITEVLDGLQQQGYLDDLRFACGYVRYAGGRFGVHRLRGDLQRRGVSVHHIDDALAAELSAPEWCRALVVLKKKYKTVPMADKMRAQAGRFLQSRGFAETAAMTAIKEYAGDVTDETDWSG